jgi:DNA-binding IscR family transcriptional regulator
VDLDERRPLEEVKLEEVVNTVENPRKPLELDQLERSRTSTTKMKPVSRWWMDLNLELLSEAEVVVEGVV